MDEFTETMEKAKLFAEMTSRKLVHKLQKYEVSKKKIVLIQPTSILPNIAQYVVPIPPNSCIQNLCVHEGTITHAVSISLLGKDYIYETVYMKHYSMLQHLYNTKFVPLSCLISPNFLREIHWGTQLPAFININYELTVTVPPILSIEIC